MLRALVGHLRTLHGETLVTVLKAAAPRLPTQLQHDLLELSLANAEQEVAAAKPVLRAWAGELEPAPIMAHLSRLPRSQAVRLLGYLHLQLRRNERAVSPSALEQALALGCGFDKSADGNNYATWPWYFSKDVIPLDPFEAMIVTGGNVPLRDGASATAKQIGTVSWDYVQLKEYSEDPYLPVVTSDGKAGFMEAKKLRSLVDYRIMADKIDGKWKVTTIIAGD